MDPSSRPQGEIPKNPLPDLKIQYGLKKESLDQSWSSRMRKLVDTSAHRTYEDMKRTRLRVFGLCAVLMSFGAMQFQFKQTVALSNNQANVQDVNRYFWQRLLFGRARSRFAAYLAQKEIPRSWRVPIYSWYGRTFNANLDEIRFPLDTYPSLQEFFTRTLVDGVRPIPKVSASVLTSPADAELVTVGEMTGDRVVQIKGATYSMKSFLGVHPTKRLTASGLQTTEDTLQEDSHKGKTKIMYCVLYLAPGDYHHFHSPCDWKVSVRRHFPGETLPVKKSLASSFNDLFSVNERVVLAGDWKHGKMHYAAVAAYNVGDIVIHCDPALKTNRVRTVPYALGGDSFLRQFEDGVQIARGDDVGVFKLGSTIVMCFEAPLDFEFAHAEGTKLKLNDILGGPKDMIEKLKNL